MNEIEQVVDLLREIRDLLVSISPEPSSTDLPRRLVDGD